MGRKLQDATVSQDDSAGAGTNSAPAGSNTGAGSTSGRKLQDAVVGTGNGGSAVSVRHDWALALTILLQGLWVSWRAVQVRAVQLWAFVPCSLFKLMFGAEL